MTTPDTEEKKVQWREVPKQVGVTLNIGDKYTYVETRLSPEEMQGIKELIEYSLTSRDTYWKERVEEVLKKAVSDGACGSYKDGIRKVLSTFTNKDDLK